MVGRCISYWNRPFLGDMLVFWGVQLFYWISAYLHSTVHRIDLHENPHLPGVLAFSMTFLHFTVGGYKGDIRTLLCDDMATPSTFQNMTWVPKSQPTFKTLHTTYFFTGIRQCKHVFHDPAEKECLDLFGKQVNCDAWLDIINQPAPGS